MQQYFSIYSSKVFKLLQAPTKTFQATFDFIKSTAKNMSLLVNRPCCVDSPKPSVRGLLPPRYSGMNMMKWRALFRGQSRRCQSSPCRCYYLCFGFQFQIYLHPMTPMTPMTLPELSACDFASNSSDAKSTLTPQLVICLEKATVNHRKDQNDLIASHSLDDLEGSPFFEGGLHEKACVRLRNSNLSSNWLPVFFFEKMDPTIAPKSPAPAKGLLSKPGS